MVSHVALHLGVGVVDDGQEHVDQHEEHEEHEQHEEDGAEDSVGRFQLVEVEVSQDDTEQSEAGMWETSGIFRGKCYKRCHIQEGKYFRHLITTVLIFFNQ